MSPVFTGCRPKAPRRLSGRGLRRGFAAAAAALVAGGMIGQGQLAAASSDPPPTGQPGETVVLRASQVGYPASGPKLGLALGMGTRPLPGVFEVVDSATSQPRFTGRTRLVEGGS